MRWRFSQWLPVLLTVAIVALTIGCTTPDHWLLWRASRSPGPSPPPDEAVDVPARLRPRPAGHAVLDPESDAPLALSIDESAVLALANNRDLRVQQYAPIIAGTFEQIERGQYDPQGFAALIFERERAGETSRPPGGLFDVDGRGADVSIGLRQRLPSGTQLEATVSHERSVSNRAPEQQRVRVGLSVTQALLRGYGPAVNLIGIRRAAIDAAASIHELKGFAEAVLGQTEMAYWHYVLARESIAIFESSLAVGRQQMAEIEKRIAVGLLPEAEAAAAHAQVAEQEQALIDARSFEETRRLHLLRLIDPAPESTLDRSISATSDPRIDPAPVGDVAARLQLADRSRPDLAEARLRLQQRRLDTVLTRNGLLPKLDLFFTVGKTGYADTFTDAFHNLEDDTYDATVGLEVIQSLGRRAAVAQDRAARASRNQAAQAVANLRQIVRLDVRLAVTEVERARLQITASQATRKYREQTLAAERQRFDVGASTSLLVAQAQRDLLAGRIAEVEAIVAYRIALVRLYLAEGSLLARRGVVFPQDDGPSESP